MCFQMLLPLSFLLLCFPVTLFAEHMTNFSDEPIEPLHVEINEDPAKVELGRRLFNEERLSYNNTVSCAHCHDLNAGGADGRKFSVGVDGKLGIINAPTVLNSRLNIAQFWDGRAATLEEQVNGPINNPVEMGSNWEEVVTKISAAPEYKALFAQAFAGVISPDTISKAIASFERTLVTPDARFDRFLRGDEHAISAEEKRGYQLFKSYGCISCHQGMAVGGNMYEKLGVLVDYYKGRDDLTESDNGRYNQTKVEEHRHEFKVPSLRNIELTAPYFHNGSAKTLEEAVETMAYHQVGRLITHEDRDLIVAFLKSLTGKYKGADQ